MINNTLWYHSHLKKAVTVFGRVFSNIFILRTGDITTKTQLLKVPLQYSPRDKFLRRIFEDPNFENQVLIKFPRIAFEIASIKRDPARQIQRTNKVQQYDANHLTSTNAPAPYIIEFNLYVASKSSEDVWQVVEQIFPIFEPDYTVTINSMPELQLEEDLPIILNGVSFEDSYDGQIQDKRTVVYTLTFTMKMNFFGPVSPVGEIKDVQVFINEVDTNLPFTSYEAKINPESAAATDVYTIDEGWEDQL